MVHEEQWRNRPWWLASVFTVGERVKTECVLFGWEGWQLYFALYLCFMRIVEEMC